MIIKKLAGAIALSLGALTAVQAEVEVSKNLPYPSATPNALEIAKQVYFVNHFYALKNYSIKKKGKTVTVIINKSKGAKPTTNSLERFLNNDYSDGEVKAKDLAIFRSGKLRGTGMLITDYMDDAKSQSYAIWLPALRKVRRFAQPGHDDAWGGSDFSFGDVYLRKPHHEDHALVGTSTFTDCLQTMTIPDNQRSKYTKNVPEAFCESKGKEVYELKSTTKFENWWYDYRISYVDTKSFADYRTDYFKNGKKVKVIDRAWTNLDGYNGSDARAVSWGYWYGKTLASEHETWAVIPSAVVGFNSDLKASLWTEKTLRKIKR